MKKRRFVSVATYIIIPVVILALLSTVSAYVSLVGFNSVDNISEKICVEQLENITVLDRINVRNERIQKLMLKLFYQAIMKPWNRCGPMLNLLLMRLMLLWSS